uniref:CSON005177 protein n=1 Tax=Culicoides sonorensis TaxID=179676 RepID=A0A336LUJ9_CULSO
MKGTINEKRLKNKHSNCLILFSPGLFTLFIIILNGNNLRLFYFHFNFHNLILFIKLLVNER